MIKLLLFLGVLFSCSSQVKQKKVLSCGNSSIEIELPKLKVTKDYSYTEGKTTLLTTIDNVIIEYYCGGNYSSHIGDVKKYKLLYEREGSKYGIDTETGLFWRKKGKLIYSNCKIKDTLYYNKMFNKVVKKNK